VSPPRRCRSATGLKGTLHKPAAFLPVLVACEFSGIVRDAFLAEGIHATSCDLLPSENGHEPHLHYQGDVRDLLGLGWSLMIAHPPCQYLASSGARWWNGVRSKQCQAVDFARALMDAPIERIALENPVGILSTRIRKPDQIIQPWQFGHGETKATCLWLKNLPWLKPTKMVVGRTSRIHRMPDKPGRSRDRSRTYAGIAKAMAEQWGAVLRHATPAL